MDDYEEGSFTPTFTTIGNGTYAVQNGSYTKIGNQLLCHIYLDINAIGNASGSIIVGGLPFLSRQQSGLYGSTSSVHGTGWATPTAGMNGLVSSNANTITFYENMVTSSNYTTNIADLGTGNMLFSIYYTTA